MNIKLTEQIIRERASDQSFQKGLEYYQSGAIYNPAWQSTPDGIALTAGCSGSNDYHLRAEMNADGVRAASCTCPYDWGGDCKHIIALLLTYLNDQDEFTEQKSVPDLLAGLEKETLVALIGRLAERIPDLYDELQRALPLVKTVAKAHELPSFAPLKARPQTQVSEPVYRKLVKKILKQSRYDEYDDYGESAPEYLDDLEETLQTARQFMDAGDAEGALIILRVLLEETVDDYDSDQDYDGEVASFIQDLGMPLAEAILSLELNADERENLEKSFQEVYDNLDDSIEESELDVIFAALEYGWNALPDSDVKVDEDGEEVWFPLTEIEQARLNVLERQGRVDEFLQLAKTADIHRYVLKLLQLGQLENAIAASQELSESQSVLDVAQKLLAAGRLDAALNLAERSLKQGGASHALAIWLAPLEEAQGRTALALLAYRAAYEAQPAIDLYRHVKRLSGSGWEAIRPELQQRIDETRNSGVLVDIHLEEHDWDAAILLAEKQSWFNLLEKVADAVTSSRPDWVINISLREANSLIVKTDSKHYPAAAKWLGRAKKGYLAKGQAAEWQAYITHLRTIYARRPSLQKAIVNL